MLASFQQNLSRLLPYPDRKSYLLAVSGGIDSMTMAELFSLSGYRITVAHCNFGLRGKESDADEDFVRLYCRSRNIPFQVKRVNTEKYAGEHKLSIQAAARQIRYEWLCGLCKKHEYDYACIAHNSDDAIETFFINLLRGTGISGLTGIDEIHNIQSPELGTAFNIRHFTVIRPLLRFSRKEIEQYARQNKIAWREDSSNATDKYQRNRIRHHLLPLMEKMQPGSAQPILATMKHLRAAEAVYRKAIDTELGRIVKAENGKVYFAKKGLSKLGDSALYLYEAIKKYDFNYVQAEELAAALDGTPGKVFLSSGHRITVDRQNLILEKKNTGLPGKPYKINKATGKVSDDSFSMKFTVKIKRGRFSPSPSPLNAYLDHGKLKFPLTLRRWEKGDKLQPLGMKQPKKVSDLLIDSKVPVSDKENIYVLISGTEIAWVAGIRIDERYKITTATKKMFICEMTKKTADCI